MFAMLFSREKRIFQAQQWIEKQISRPRITASGDYNLYTHDMTGQVERQNSVCGYRKDRHWRGIIVEYFYVQNDNGLTLQIPYDWIKNKIKLLRAEYQRRRWWYDHFEAGTSTEPLSPRDQDATMRDTKKASPFTAEDLKVMLRWVAEAFAELRKSSNLCGMIDVAGFLTEYTYALQVASLAGDPIRGPWITSNLADRPRWLLSHFLLPEHILCAWPSSWPRAIFDMPFYSDQDNLPPVVLEKVALLADANIPRTMFLHVCHEEAPTHHLAEEMKTLVNVLEREGCTQWWKPSKERGRYRKSRVTACLPWLRPKQQRRAQDARGVWQDEEMN